MPRADKIYRQEISTFTELQSAKHIDTGVARIKLGRALLRQNRYAEAEA
jgi:serine/threonine-protein kinase